MNRQIRVCLFMLLAFAGGSQAQTKPSAAGHWEGSINVPSMELKVIIDLDRDASGTWIADIDIPDQKVVDLPLRNVAVSGNSISFELPAGPGEPKFKGSLSADGNTISGDFSQNGNVVPFSLKRNGEARVFIPPKIAALPAKFTGKWEGNLDTMGGSLHLVFNLVNNEDGSGGGSIDSPDQGAMGIPMSDILASANSIKIATKVINGEFKGKLSDDGTVLTGDWFQGGTSMPLSLKKAAPAKN